MFTFDATPVKFVGLLVMFLWCTTWCVVELVRARTTSQRVSGALHLMMAVVMLLMVPRPLWQPFAGLVGMPVIVGAFAAATAWFGWLAWDAWRRDGRRAAGHAVAHTAMFAAMTWHLVAMAFKRPHMGPGMAEWTATESRPGGVLWIMALVGVPFMAYLLASGIVFLTRVFQPAAEVNDACPCGGECRCGPSCSCASAHDTVHSLERELAVVGGAAPTPVAQAAPVTHSCRVESPVGSRSYRLAALSDASMNLGMFWMSTGLMTALLPFFGYLAF